MQTHRDNGYLFEGEFIVSHKLRAAWKLISAAILVAALAGAARARPSEPTVSVSPNQISFPAQIQGTDSPPQPIVLTNTGDGELTINAIAIGGQNADDFRQTNNCPVAPATLAAHAMCTIQVVFRPTSVGSLAAALAITDNASGSPRTIPLSGGSTMPAPLVTVAPTSLSFDSQPAGKTSGVLVAVLTNMGSANLNITSPIRINGQSADEFHLQKIANSCPYDSGQVAAKTNCSIAVVFAPATTGTKSAQVIIEDDAAGSPHAIALAGTGVATRDAASEDLAAAVTSCGAGGAAGSQRALNSSASSSDAACSRPSARLLRF